MSGLVCQSQHYLQTEQGCSRKRGVRTAFQHLWLENQRHLWSLVSLLTSIFVFSILMTTEPGDDTLARDPEPEDQLNYILISHPGKM